MYSSPLITIITATYNRFELLKRLHCSLQQQTSLDFEWLIVDDGSIDDTKGLIENFSINSEFCIRYISKENGGKHSALNVGFKNALGKWVLIVDSDDWLDPRCIETLADEISSTEFFKFSAISFLKTYPNGKIVGDIFPAGLHNYKDRVLSNVRGDKADLLKLSALNGFSFPEFSGERFMAESYLFLWFSKKNETKFVNYPGYFCEYQKDGLSAESVSNRHKSCYSTLFNYAYQYNSFSELNIRSRAAFNWWRFKFGKNIKYDWRPPFIYAPLGFFLYIKDRLRS